MGNLIEAQNNDSNIKFELDIMERITKTIQDGHIIENTYDKLGQRIKVTSSLGACIEQEHTKTGEINKIQAYAQSKNPWISEMKYNALGQEIQRTMPGE